MRQFHGGGARVYAAGPPFAFSHVPLDDCGDGFAWRCADETLRCWVEGEPLVFECFEDGAWRPVAPLEVQHAAGCVSFGRSLRDMPARVSGVALPTALLVEDAEWELEQTVIEAKSLSGLETVLGKAIAWVRAVAPEVAVTRVLAVLPTAATGAFVGLGRLSRDTPGLKVIFDEGVTYASS